MANSLIIKDAMAGHVDAHIGGRLVRRFSEDVLEHRVQNGEHLNVTVIVDRCFVICLKVERVDHVDIVKICRRGLICKVNGMLEREVPDREGLKLGVSGLHSALVLMVEL